MSNKSASEGVKVGIDVKLILEALTGEMRRLLKFVMDQFHEMVEQWFEQSKIDSPRDRKETATKKGVKSEEEYSNDEASIDSNRRYGGRVREDRNWEDNSLGNIKMKISPFQGKNDLEEYLE